MYYRKSNPHGGDIKKVNLDFSVSLNPLGPPEGVILAVKDSVGEIASYPDPGYEDLLSALSEKESLPAECFILGNGAAELIFNYVGAVRPKRVLTLAPAFSEYKEAAMAYDAEVIEYKLEAEDDFLPDERFIEYIEKEKFDALFLCNPNNPTGRLMRREYIEKIVSGCRKRNTKIFLDECFMELGSTDFHGLSPEVLNENPNSFILKAFTKTYAMPGLRLGYGISADKNLLEKMSRFTQPWNVSSVSEKAGLAALSEREYVKKAREIIKEEIPRVSSELRTLGFTVVPSEANFILFYTGSSDLKLRLLEKGMLIRDCSNFSGLGPGWYRIGIKLPKENDVLINAIRELKLHVL